MEARPEKGNKPAFNARAKQSPDSEYMVTIGAAWRFNNGGGFVVNLNMLPTHWDGKFILVPPKSGD